VPFDRRKVTDPVGTYAPSVTLAVIRTAVPTRAVAGIDSVVAVGARAIDTDEDDDVAACVPSVDAYAAYTATEPAVSGVHDAGATAPVASTAAVATAVPPAT
jgi:hypothetical protein